MRRPPWRTITHGAPVIGVAAALLAVLTWPLLFTYSGFANDWEHHLWLLWHQSLSIQSGDFPSLYLNSSYSVFYPLYAFYGGTLYAVGGLLSLALGGSPLQAYVLIYLLDFAAAFGGWYWLARMAGVGRWLAIVPGLIFVTSTYYLVLLYVRGDWAEFTGVSTIPLMVAAGLSVLRAERPRVGARMALAASAILFFGAHNITILLGLTTLALSALAILACVPEARRSVTRRGAIRLARIAVPAALVSAWYLLPALAYQSSTHIAHEHQHTREQLRSTVGLVSLGHLFTFSRTYGPAVPAPYYLSLSLPVLAIAWVLAGILVLPRGSRQRTWLRLLLVFSGVTVLIAVMMTHAGLLLALPRVYSTIQFSYRLETYVLLGLSAAVLAALALARQRSRWARAWSWMAVPVCAVSLFGAIQQTSALPNPGQDRYEALESYGEVDTGNNQDFQDVSEPVIPARNLAALDIPFESVHGDRVSFTTQLPPGTLAATNIGAGSDLVHVTGATAVGVDSETGDMVLRIGSGGAGGEESGVAGGGPGVAGGASGSSAAQTISVSTGKSLPIVLGRVLTMLGLALLALELAVLPARRLLSRRARSPAGPSTPSSAAAQPAIRDIHY
jgi:hypothetical protein